jgi:cobalt-zinc-cadmium efflux system membrane fusion protein
MRPTLNRLLLAALLVVLPLPADWVRAEEGKAPPSVNCPHDASKALCFICDPALREKGRLWCKEHTCYEDRCWECHPDMQDKDRAFCAKHRLYKDECFLCKPELKAPAKPAAAAGGKCAAHDVPKELCFICDPALREKGRLWCNEHKRYEDRCWECHPDARDPKRAFCDEHGLYEDECFFCNPELKTKPKAGAQIPTAGARLMCKEHNVYEDECGICHPDLAGAIEPGGGLKVRLASVQAAAKAGIETALPRVGPMTDGIECYAELVFDQNKLAQITAPVGGILRSVEVDLGQKVEAGSCLANLWSAEIGEAVSRALLARQALERERKLRADRISSERDLQEAEAAYQTAYQNVRTLGFEDAAIAALATNAAQVAVVPLRAPFAGEIIERSAVRGARVEAGTTLFTLADWSTLWAMLTIPEKHLARVRLDQPVELRFDAFPGQVFTGRLTWIAAQLDERTRMVRARAEVLNPDGQLRAQMFAQARLLTGRADKAVSIPQAAVQQIEGRSFVFTRAAEDLYEARSIRLGAKQDGYVQVLEGLGPAEPVVIANAFLVKSQMLISRLGAGCCPAN